MRAACADQARLAIRGGASKGFHPFARAAQGAEWLDLRACRGVVAYEPSELVVTARAGTPLCELEAELAAHGQCLAFEPPRYGAGGTVGGMVATGLSGPARASRGALRDFVLGVEIINGRGERLRFGGQVMKNVAGYDVSRLMAGSWGRLAVITEVSLKVLPVAPAEATLRLELGQADALARLHRWGGQPLPLEASCWLEDAGVATLFVRLRGARAAVQAACASMGGERIEDARVPADWDACRDQRLPWFAGRAAGHALWRLALPQAAPVLALPEGAGPPLIEWHGGLRWVQAPPQAGPQLHALAAQVGGSASLFIAADVHATGAKDLFDLQSPALASIHRRVAQAFDPGGVFQPPAA